MTFCSTDLPTYMLHFLFFITYVNDVTYVPYVNDVTYMPDINYVNDVNLRA